MAAAVAPHYFASELSCSDQETAFSFFNQTTVSDSSISPVSSPDLLSFDQQPLSDDSIEDLEVCL